MKKGKVFFHPINGSALLTISWTSGPKGDAVEAKKGAGVGFFSDSGDLLCVIFDEVRAIQDHQFLEFNRFRVEVTVKNSKVSFLVSEIKPRSKVSKKIKRRRLINK
jgi:hypothetical protein